MADTKIPDWKLERFLLCELPSDEMRSIERSLSSDPGLKRRLEALEASNMAILEAHPPGEMAKAILNRAGSAGAWPARAVRPRSSYRRALLPAIAFGTAALIFALVKPAGFDREAGLPVGDVPDVIRLKGMEPGLFVFKKSAGGPERLSDGAQAASEDVLQLAYVSTERSYGIILSIDGRGAVTLHHPSDPAASPRLELNRRVFLEKAYQLDDAPGFERFFYLSSSSPPDVAMVLQAARRLAADPERAAREPLALDASVRQIFFMVNKGSTR